MGRRPPHQVSGPTLRSQWLGQNLRQLRTERGLSLQDAADFVGVGSATVSRIENALAPIRRGDLKELLTLFRADEPIRKKLLDLREVAWRRDWWDDIPDGKESTFADFAWLESRAIKIQCFENMVPGMFQTRDYSEAIIRACNPDGASATKIKEWAALRARRQQHLTGPNAPTIAAIIDEVALRREVGGRQTMTAQLKRLAELARHPHITIRVLPLKAADHPGYLGNFWYFGLENPYPDVAYTESVVSRMFVEDEAKLDRLRAMFAGIAEASMKPHDSIAFITKLGEEL